MPSGLLRHGLQRSSHVLMEIRHPVRGFHSQHHGWFLQSRGSLGNSLRTHLRGTFPRLIDRRAIWMCCPGASSQGETPEAGKPMCPDGVHPLRHSTPDVHLCLLVPSNGSSVLPPGCHFPRRCFPSSMGEQNSHFINGRSFNSVCL